MKFTSAVLFLVTLGLVKAAEVKAAEVKTKNDGKFPDWKKAAEHAQTVTEAKHKAIHDLVEKLPEEAKTPLQAEVALVKAEVDKVILDVKAILAFEEEFKKAKTDEEKATVAGKAAAAGLTLATKFLVFETALKKASLAYTKSFVAKEGHSKILEFLKGKVANLEKDGFLTSSLLAAVALSAVAVGATFN